MVFLHLDIHKQVLGEPAMIFPNVSLDTWLLKYPTLSSVETTCIDCGSKLKAVVPFVEKHYAGLKSQPCTCGSSRSVCSSQVTTSLEENASWSAVMDY